MKYVIATLLLIVGLYLSTSIFNFDAWIGVLCIFLTVAGFSYYIYKQLKKVKQVNKNENVENENF